MVTAATAYHYDPHSLVGDGDGDRAKGGEASDGVFVFGRGGQDAQQCHDGVDDLLPV